MDSNRFKWHGKVRSSFQPFSHGSPTHGIRQLESVGRSVGRDTLSAYADARGRPLCRDDRNEPSGENFSLGAL